MKAEESYCNTILHDKFIIQLFIDEKIKAKIITKEPELRLDEFDIEGIIESLYRTLNDEQKKNIIKILEDKE